MKIKECKLYIKLGFSKADNQLTAQELKANISQ